VTYYIHHFHKRHYLVCRGYTVLKLLADDVKLYYEIDHGDASASFQLSLDNLTQWAKDWQLTINMNKCSIMSINSKNHYSCARFYHVDGPALPQQSSYADLGVTIISDLYFETHFANIVARARQSTNILFHGFVPRNLSVMRQAYTTHMQPILEYKCSVESRFNLFN
jgi:hypothetical protein